MSHTAPDGGLHRADIKTPAGIVIEVQHSTMTDKERESREAFYENLIWIVDGRSFQNSFYLGWMLPDPSANGLEDAVWFQQPQDAFRRPWDSADAVTPFWRISEERKQYPNLTRENVGSVMPSDSLVLVHDGVDVHNQVLANYVGHHQFHWTRPRRMWFNVKCPVYIDFGEEVLYPLVEDDDRLGLCVRLAAKRKLIHDAMVESCAKELSTPFYPMN